ncbi:cadherin-related family member 5 isoform X2 [Lemur catta]|uniref:cadherin-related family member 5 isoform X2 n=1 Tax=Lemur catta TaxID=9447 RepID=UPI001E26C115|nr:cadherin-related family member 5 isoform X2 [Lemur catta]
MGAWAQLWPPLLLMGLLGRPPGAEAQAQVCSVSKTFFEVEENTNLTEPLVDIDVPDGQQVTLGASSTLFAFRIVGNQLFLNVTPDYEENALLQAHLECKSGDTVVTQLRVFVAVLDVNDNAPVFPFTTKETAVEEDTKVNSTVIAETELEATDEDQDDILFYTLQEVTLGASDFFSLAGVNRPALRLDRSLDVYKWPNMTFRLLVRPSPLVLRPGPIYAEDGDRAINQRIIYSIIRGNVNDTFALSPESGNLTMAQSVPSPTTFLLVVKAEQADLARYSVTQVTVEVLAATGSLPRFPQSLYRGTLAPGSGVGVAVQDAAAPSEVLRIQAEDPDFPDFNSAITYRVTNHSDFRMDGEFLLTTTSLAQLGVFYAEVEANNTVTLGTATTVVEIQVSEQEPPSTGPPGAGGTTEPSNNTTVETPRPTGPSQGPSTTSSGGSTGPRPLSGTTLRPTASPTPEGPPSVGNSTSSQPATPGGGSAQTPKPGTSQTTPPSVGNSTFSQPASPGGGSAQTPKPGTSRTTPPSVGNSTFSQPATPGGGSAQTPKPGTSQTTPPGPSRSSLPSGISGGGLAEDKRFSVGDMATLGGVLGVLLLLALLGLAVLVHKHYGQRLKCCSRLALDHQPGDFDNQAFLDGHDGHEANWAPAPSPGHSPKTAEAPPRATEPAPREPPAPPSPAPRSRAPGSPAVPAGGSPTAVRSILTKERRPEGGYKAVWFGEGIGAEANVVVNAPSTDADRAGDSGNEGSGDEDAEADSGRGGSPHDGSLHDGSPYDGSLHDEPGAGSTYI